MEVNDMNPRRLNQHSAEAASGDDDVDIGVTSG